MVMGAYKVLYSNTKCKSKRKTERKGKEWEKRKYTNKEEIK